MVDLWGSKTANAVSAAAVVRGDAAVTRNEESVVAVDEESRADRQFE